MRLISATVENFGSYKDLTFDYENKGLTLIHGSTGSGKSTLLDVACWIMLGITAKGGNADEVRSWQAGSDPTTGELELETSDGSRITIVRVRGRSTQNDLYWIENEVKTRGKDLNETQALLEKRLGITANLYLAGGYYSEFSPTGSFFTAKAKDRREVFEEIVSLDLPILLANRSTEARKLTKQQLIEANRAYERNQGRRDELLSSQRNAERDSQAWEHLHSRSIQELKEKSENFQEEIQSKIAAAKLKVAKNDFEHDQKMKSIVNQIDSLYECIELPEEFDAQIEREKLNSKCTLCGTQLTNAVLIIQEKKQRNQRLIDQQDLLMKQLEQLANTPNPYLSELMYLEENSINSYKHELEREINKVNPLLAAIERYKLSLDVLDCQLRSTKQTIEDANKRLKALQTITDLSIELRMELLRNAIKAIEQDTNRRLEKYFYAELRVEFNLIDGDSLDVVIFKSGYECVYRQLSKGQRQLLRLSFVTSVMKAASEKTGIHFAQLFMDEFADGLDEQLKIKAFALLEELSLKHETVMVIDHSEQFKQMFTNSIRVSLDGDRSILE